jgi:cytochrome c-type biogenesis protein CcmI
VAVDVSGRTRYDPDELARLEEQRDFIRRSLVDLDRERDAGDLDDADHAALADDYRRRLSEAEASLAAGRSTVPPPSSRRGRVVATVVVVAVLSLAAGLGVAAFSGGREPGDTITGEVPQTTVQRLAQASRLAQAGEITDALELYDEVLETDPENVEALAERGFLLVTASIAARRPQLAEQGQLSVEEALRLDPGNPRTLFYLAVARRLLGDDAGAEAALTDALANDPPSALRTQIEQFRASLAAADAATTTTTTTAPG